MDPIGNEKTITNGGTAQDAPLPAGSVFGQYQIIRLLGRGGMGAVYEVEHTTLGRRYALKLLPADFINSPNALERFKREARVMANLEHPNIIRVDEFGETDGRYWLRMELADGISETEVGAQKTEVSLSTPDTSRRDSEASERHPTLVTLSDLAKANDGKLPQEVLLPILGNILDGLAYAHERGAVHRDLKPSNILLTTNHTNIHEKESSKFSVLSVVKNCTAKIADFGLVKLVGEEWIYSMVELSVQRSMSLGDEKTIGGTSSTSSAGTSTKSLLGTYEYMSPEQKRGEEADARSDIYAVGLMIYKLLTGRELGMRTPSQIDPSLDKGWDAVVLKALEEKSEDRFQSVSELRSQLSGISYQESGSVTAKERTERRKENVDAVPPPRSEDVARERAQKSAKEEYPVDPVIPSKNTSGWKWAVAAMVLILVVAGFSLARQSKIEDPLSVKSNVGQASSLSSSQPDVLKGNSKPSSSLPSKTVAGGLAVQGKNPLGYVSGIPISDRQTNDVVVIVNGQNITHGEIMQGVQMNIMQLSRKVPAQELSLMTEQVYTNVTDTLIANILLADAAEKSHLTVSDAELSKEIADVKAKAPAGSSLKDALAENNIDFASWKNELREQMLVRKLVEEKTSNISAVTSAEITKYYDENRDAFKAPETITASHILKAFTSGDTAKIKAQKKAALEKIRVTLLAGADFSTIAKEESDCPSKARGGDLGAFTRGKMVPEFEQAAFSLPVGAISDVVETQFGYHLIKVTAHQQAGFRPLSEVKDQLNDYLIQQKRQAALLAYIEGLKSKAEIEYH